MNTPKQPRLPQISPEPLPDRPHPLNRPDERKEGGPDYDKAQKQREHHERTEDDAEAARD